MADLSGKRIAFLATRGVEQVELTSPWEAITNAGGEPVLVSSRPGSITAMQQDWDLGATFTVEEVVAEADPASFDALVLPGGTLNSDQLRTNPEVLDFVRSFFFAEKPVAAICHAPWVLINAGVIDGRRITSVDKVSLDVKNAGGNWVDAPVVVDRGLTTSRNPGDLEDFNAKIVEEFASA